jgi:hypothetical protein
VLKTILSTKDGAPATTVARGRALRTVLLEALYRLRPEGAEPAAAEIASCEEWHPFLILHDLYELGHKVNDIRWKYPYSDKTFYRRRSEAVEAVAKTVWQMEQEAMGTPAA